MSATFKCSKCQMTFDPKYYNAGYFISCPVCASALRVDVFPALHRPPVIRRGENVVEEGQASCFYHPAKNAEMLCEGCGRFLCALCDIEMSGKHYCPGCLESSKKKGKMPTLQREYTRYDKIAGTLAMVSLVFWPIAIITAPSAIIISIYHWRTPCSLVRKPHGTFVIAILLSLILLAIWAMMGLALMGSFEEVLQ